MHPPLNIAAVLACSNLLALTRGVHPCRRAAARSALAEAGAARDASCHRHAKHFAAAVFGWGKWQGPSVGVDMGDLSDLLDDPSPRGGPRGADLITPQTACGGKPAANDPSPRA